MNAEALIGALADLYANTYGVEHSEVRSAAELRAGAMDVSDRWVGSFAALLAAVHRPGQ